MAMVNNDDYGHAVQVVRVSEGPGKRYVLEEQALATLLGSPDVLDRPVAVVSVAGSFRGGKSFLLGFFLRYLNASRTDQMNGQWLGKEDEPLRGFKWRAGCNRETTGIHLWSKPAIVKLDNGQEVAVLLMDTQGTFDSESTLQDSSTIFALSTLMSTVQIYNIFRNIQEDDLQHLHLFTEYGQLGSGDDEDVDKKFQVLQFLVRDWPNDYDYPYGADGGGQFLNQRLKMSNNQKPELREVRQHIRSCFESIRCCLMPHPGFSAERKHFSGCLKDLTEEFKMGLREFVPSLFDPKNLIHKEIAGNRVKTQDLFLYFRTYVDIFNSEELPPAVSILRGTATAWLAAAQRDACEAYEALMQDTAYSVTPDALQLQHTAALQTAQSLFNGKKKLGTREEAAKYYGLLNKDLDGRLAVHLWRNDTKLRKSLAAARKSYDDMVDRVCGGLQRLCLHPRDLELLHEEALATALAMFDSTRRLAEGEKDEERVGLSTKLSERYNHILKTNEHNNTMAVDEAKLTYVTVMRGDMPMAAGVRDDMLLIQHEKALNAAREKFASWRSQPTEHEEDEYMNKLLQGIEKLYLDFQRANSNSNNMAMLSAEHAYNNYMTTQWGPQVCCYHPRALTKLHKEAKDIAIKNYQTNRAKSNDHDEDCDDELLESLGTRYRYYQHNNEYNNEQAVDAGFTTYSNWMNSWNGRRPWSIFVWWFATSSRTPSKSHHDKGRDKAQKEFFKKRRGPKYDDDDYVDNLNEKIDEAYSKGEWDNADD